MKKDTSKFKKMKVFRTCNMPAAIKELVRKKYPSLRCGDYKNIYTHEEWFIVDIVPERASEWAKSYYVGDILDKRTGAKVLLEREEDGLIKIIEEGYCPLSDWLVENGANIHEEVLIWDM